MLALKSKETFRQAPERQPHEIPKNDIVIIPDIRLARQWLSEGEIQGSLI
jgi:hypothetical protein